MKSFLPTCPCVFVRGDPSRSGTLVVSNIFQVCSPQSAYLFKRDAGDSGAYCQSVLLMPRGRGGRLHQRLGSGCHAVEFLHFLLPNDFSAQALHCLPARPADSLYPVLIEIYSDSNFLQTSEPIIMNIYRQRRRLLQLLYKKRRLLRLVGRTPTMEETRWHSVFVVT